MTVSGHGQPHTAKGQAFSTGTLAALLTALLILSPTTARAVAQVLAQNGVALPAQVVRVLEALPTETVRDTVRRDDEPIVIAPVADVDSVEDEPVAVTPAPLPPSTLWVPPLLRKREGGVSEEWHGVVTLPSCAATCLIPRAPPV